MSDRSVLRLIVQPLAIAVVLALCVRLVIKLYTVPSVSMMPTLLPGDHIVVCPYRLSTPRRGDVVVFRSVADDELLVKRIVATPGELVETSGGHLRVGGHAVAEPYVNDASASGGIQPQIVPSDTYFVLGDNRSNSSDSRVFGPLPRARIVGRVRMVLWSSETTPAETARVSGAGGKPLRESGLNRFFKWIE